MKKIPTLFTRVYENHKIVDILPEVTPGCEEAFLNGAATIKVDGSCCAVINGEFYKRYDAKKGTKPPVGAIPCDNPDPVTGHHPHWVKIDKNNPSDKWFLSAYNNYGLSYNSDGHFEVLEVPNGTYEAVGPHFNDNPYDLEFDILIRHGICGADVNRDFESIKKYLTERNIEGLVFWLNGEPICKVKRSDFGLKWPAKE